MILSDGRRNIKSPCGKKSIAPKIRGKRKQLEYGDGIEKRSL